MPRTFQATVALISVLTMLLLAVIALIFQYNSTENTVIKLEPHTYKCQVSRISLNQSHADADQEPPSH